jgi:hypothetical protein
MSSRTHKLLSLFLAGLMLLAPLGNAFASLAGQGAPMAVGSHGMASQMGDCANCVAPGDGDYQGKPCCDGASCALMGGCGACAATFFSVRMPVRVTVPGLAVPEAAAVLLSHEPDLFLRPPRT